jgi:hypothetical protein
MLTPFISNYYQRYTPGRPFPLPFPRSEGTSDAAGVSVNALGLRSFERSSNTSMLTLAYRETGAEKVDVDPSALVAVAVRLGPRKAVGFVSVKAPLDVARVDPSK